MDDRSHPIKLGRLEDTQSFSLALYSPIESSDGISRARFSPFDDAASKDMLVVSSWDCSVAVYNAHETATSR